MMEGRRAFLKKLGLFSSAVGAAAAAIPEPSRVPSLKVRDRDPEIAQMDGWTLFCHLDERLRRLEAVADELWETAFEEDPGLFSNRRVGGPGVW